MHNFNNCVNKNAKMKEKTTGEFGLNNKPKKKKNANIPFWDIKID